MTQAWWTPRQKDEATSDYLARVLHALRLLPLAERAKLGLYDDFKCPETCEWAGQEHIQLYRELNAIMVATKQRGRRDEIKAVMEAVKDGEFDSTKAESDAWAASPQGQVVMNELARAARWLSGSHSVDG
jgi:hypothetical protein